MPAPAFARGEAVSLHPIEERDHEFLQYGHNHPDIRPPLGSSTIHARDDIEETVEESEYRFLVCADVGGDSPTGTDGYDTTGAERDGGRRIEDERDLERVGLVALPWVFEDTRSAFLMYWIAPAYQGNGYGTEATELLLDYVFRECGFHKIGAYVHEENAASAALLETLGFEREGTLRREVFVDGEWLDQYRYGMLADTWLDR